MEGVVQSVRAVNRRSYTVHQTLASRHRKARVGYVFDGVPAVATAVRPLVAAAVSVDHSTGSGIQESYGLPNVR